MKKIGWITVLAGLMACGDNNSGGSDAGPDTGAMGGHTAPMDTSVAGGNNQGGSMMDLMERNMDQMQEMRSTGNPDQDFAALMKVHHQGAIEMAQLQLQQGTDAQLKQMAQKMITDQQREISELDAFLSNNDTTAARASGGDAYYKAVQDSMGRMNMSGMNHGGSVDQQFVSMMIPHHQGGVDMARAYLRMGARDAKLKQMANSIITEQQKEIRQLQAWQEKSGGSHEGHNH